MKTALDNTVKLIDEMSRSNSWDDPKKAAQHLVEAVFETEARAACQVLLDDPNWSQDREPYTWLSEVMDAI